jgi:Xaa-Pro dipeptidase
MPMKQRSVFFFATFLLSFMVLAPVSAQQTPAERVSEIQAALGKAKLDGWLFCDFRHSDPLAYRILKLDEDMGVSRRWYYYVPASGEPVKVVQSIEQFKLDTLPGRKLVFRGWRELQAHLRDALGAKSGKAKRIAMQYSPMNDIPYVSKVDAGTIELVRSFGVEPVTSAELVQRFEAVLSPMQHATHVEASDKMHRIIQEAFSEIARRIRADQPTTEWDIQQFMLRRYEEEGMKTEPMIVAVNANAANPHYVPTDKVNSPIKRNDFVLIDAATKLKTPPDAVATDQTWTGYVGESVPEEYSRIFSIVREARDAAVEFVRKNVRAGKSVRGAQVDDVSRGVIKRAGYGEQFTHRTGHSIGEEVHGNGVNIDDFETRDSRQIIPGVCFSIEPGIYLEGKFGVRSEIDVYVSEKDIEVTGEPIQTEVIAVLKTSKE